MTTTTRTQTQAKMNLLTTTALFAALIQSLGSAIVFLILGGSLDKMNFKKRFHL